MVASENPFLDGLLSNTRRQFKLTKERKDGLQSLVEEAKNGLGIQKAASAIVEDLMKLGIVSRYYDYKDWIAARRKESPRKKPR